jgi:serine/threonine protein kinase
LARAADDAAITQSGWLAGTPHYMSPEQAQGQDIDYRSDLFSFGSVLYFMATGREPFRGDQPFAVLQKIINDQPIAAHHVNSDIPPTLSRIIERLHGKRPDQRFQTAEQLHATFEQYLEHLQHPQSAQCPVIRGTRPTAASVRGFALAAFSVFLAIAAIVYAFQTRQTNRVETEITWQFFTDSIGIWHAEADRLDADIGRVEAELSECRFISPFMDGVEIEMEKIDREIDRIFWTMDQFFPSDELNSIPSSGE